MEDNIFQTRYPNYNVLDQWSSPDWDDQTREVVRRRLEEIPPIRFFAKEEAQLLTAVTERIVPQSDRLGASSVPIIPWIDEKLHEDKRDGYRYEQVPPQREAWRIGLKGIDEERILSPVKGILPDLTKRDEPIFTGLAAVKVMLRPVTSRDKMASS